MRKIASKKSSLRLGRGRNRGTSSGWHDVQNGAEMFAEAYRKSRRKLATRGFKGNRFVSWQDEEDYLQEAALKLWAGLLEGSLVTESEEHLVNLLRRTSLHAGIDAWRKETRCGKVRLDAVDSFEKGNLESWDDFGWAFELDGIFDQLSDEEKSFSLYASRSWLELARVVSPHRYVRAGGQDTFLSAPQKNGGPDSGERR